VTSARGLPIAAAAGLVLSLGPAGSASARAIDPAGTTIGNTARLSASARTLRLDGVVACADCRAFTLGATVTQSTSAAVAQGGVRCVCHGVRERWFLTARAREGTKFQAGGARVCVWIIARGATGTAIDANQWCETVTLRFASA
jgi:hypothetical protein